MGASGSRPLTYANGRQVNKPNGSSSRKQVASPAFCVSRFLFAWLLERALALAADHDDRRHHHLGEDVCGHLTARIWRLSVQANTMIECLARRTNDRNKSPH